MSTILETAIVTARNVKAADPGLGFDLLMTEDAAAVNQTVKVILHILDGRTTTATSALEIDTPITDEALSIVMPFGDASYAVGDQIDYSIEVQSPIGTVVYPAQGGSVVKGNGRFASLALVQGIPPCPSPQSSPSRVLRVGQMIGSVDGSHFGILQSNGSFGVLPLSFVTLGDTAPATSFTPVSTQVALSNIGLYVSTTGYIFIQNLTTSGLICRSVQSLPGASMIIEGGIIMLKGDGAGIPVTFTTSALSES